MSQAEAGIVNACRCMGTPVEVHHLGVSAISSNKCLFSRADIPAISGTTPPGAVFALDLAHRESSAGESDKVENVDHFEEVESVRTW